ncbi:cytochrome c3 family protein [Inmirania thermothiophila]|uniref:nitrite reductase (cytochrome; ammonia-forming) n=1 Tax=Inmirania thermothiophila TaxID=1750597 RepID=A0A3N1Y266_9GAMM|nr:cytochrome c3 family protein [Inmirania thermothiophila]ROR32914.1 doubled CXXCH motif protein [Inmirania thermothiophila]
MGGPLLQWVACIVLAGLAPAAWAAHENLPNRVNDIASTKHNLSAASSNTVRAAAGETTEICVFCHTPHGATQAKAPLWNRKLSSATYTTYGSDSMDASVNQPGGSSKLCLSCHDGTLAIGMVNVLEGQGGPSNQQPITMQGVGAGGEMPAGQGTQTGFTRNLGTDLTNDHPISFTYDSALAAGDGELRDPATASHIGLRGPGVHPAVPLEPTGPAGEAQVQCASCHDPHVRSTDPTENIKFLRLNRFQKVGAPSGGFDLNNDIVCLACHDKAGDLWGLSAHAHPGVADERYKDTEAALREFPSGIQVWEAGCLNCHDPHTVQGARRLTREGTDSTASPKSGGNPAIEETCYQCHTNATESILTADGGGAPTQVPNIEDDFRLARHMPITNADQPAGTEVHDIEDKDFTEAQAKLGKGNLTNRHAECTDCHNPHRVTKTRRFNDDPAVPAAAGTHEHTTGTLHTNLASGVLRGAWGVEPIYASEEFGPPGIPTGFEVKKGVPPIGGSTAVSAPYVTREYQICLKCHSNYGYDDDGGPDASTTRPALGSFGGGTPSGTNGLTHYTNQAMEFQAPVAHRGEGQNLGAEGGASPLYDTNNHRSWHPVMGPTGRTAAIRNADASNWLEPFDNDVGNQTMYCTDCHGSATANGTAVPSGGEDGNPWGPHGSSKNFILKGDWDSGTGSGQGDDLCFKCHDFQTYPRDGGGRTGFYGGGRGDLHSYHADKIGRMRCTWCHIAVPHGWKNKALLVNLNDVGPEAGLPKGTEVCTGNDGWGTGNRPPGSSGCNGKNSGFTMPPYYLNAFLKVVNFAPSGSWSETSCGSRSGVKGRDWMRDTACDNPP